MTSTHWHLSLSDPSPNQQRVLNFSPHFLSPRAGTKGGGNVKKPKKEDKPKDAPKKESKEDPKKDSAKKN